jgi:hypothetical protein
LGEGWGEGPQRPEKVPHPNSLTGERGKKVAVKINITINTFAKQEMR